MNPASFHPHTGSHRIYVRIISGYGDFRSASRLAGRPHNTDDTFRDFGNFCFKKINYEVRMCPRKNNLRATSVMQNIKNICADSIPPAISFFWNLFSCRDNAFRMTEVNNNVTTLNSLNNSINDFTLSVNEAGKNRIPFSILHFLDNNLLGRLSSNSTECGGIHLHTETVAYFTFRVQLHSFLKRNLEIRFGNFFCHFFKLENFDFTRFFAILNFDVGFASKLFFSCRPKRLLKCFYENITVDPLVSTHLFNHTLNICYEHLLSP